MAHQTSFVNAAVPLWELGSFIPHIEPPAVRGVKDSGDWESNPEASWRRIADDLNPAARIRENVVADTLSPLPRFPAFRAGDVRPYGRQRTARFTDRKGMGAFRGSPVLSQGTVP
jgi:hypothetical protein